LPRGAPALRISRQVSGLSLADPDRILAQRPQSIAPGNGLLR
jgi:hypothetical protein